MSVGSGGYFSGGCVHRAPCFCFNHWSWLGLHCLGLVVCDFLGLLAVVLYCAPCFFVDVYGTAPPASLCISLEREALYAKMTRILASGKNHVTVAFLDTPAVPVENELNTNVLSENCKCKIYRDHVNSFRIISNGQSD
ncbi:hypothetical protein DFH29DRAFT_881652 [Suillus ampliporus]|nr:hypothetical protein DFH29DRAFT_881652 [Suillus ampliporus]